jgi:hypothetical protein
MALSRPERVTLEADEGLLASTVLDPGQIESIASVTTHLIFFLLVGNTQSLDDQVCPGYLAQYTYISSMSSIDFGGQARKHLSSFVLSILHRQPHSTRRELTRMRRGSRNTDPNEACWPGQ